MVLGLLESYYKSDHYPLTPLCPAYAHAPYMQEYVLVTHLRIYAGSAYMAESHSQSDWPAVSKESKNIHIRPEMNEIWS
jgi:hypothetical protein